MARPLKIKKVSSADKPETTAVRILRTRAKEFYSHWPDPDRQPTEEQIHDLRISGKRLRYSAESLRELYPDRLALLIDLLKRCQDLTGEIQDCVTQREMIEADLARLRRRDPHSSQIKVFEKIISEYHLRHSTLFSQFHEIWRGMTMPEFRDGLKAMISRAKGKRKKSEITAPSEAGLHLVAPPDSVPVDQAGHVAGAKSVVDVDDRDV